MSDRKASLDSTDVLRMVAAAAEELAAHEDDLSRLDAVAGDGDHGLNMRGAMARATDLAQALDGATPSEVFDAVATAFFDGPGGASGALFGSFFRGIAGGIGTRTEVDASTLAQALAAGLSEVRRVGKAVVGDKTMLDALAPAVDAAVAAARARSLPAQVLSAAAAAARAGAERSSELTAGAGRARYSGDRSMGSRDPGASSAALILEAWARAASPVKSLTDDP